MTTTLFPRAQAPVTITNYRFRSPQLRKQAEAALTTLRAHNRQGRRLKTATLGGEPEQSFEQALASLAFSYIKDKAPRLLEFMAGFQLVDRNEDNTKAVGVFGFRVANTWVYAPVFFLNGDLKGHELLYIKSQDMFVPLKENWVNYLLAKKPHVLGEQTGESVRSLGILQPDVRSLSVPPFYSKYGGADDAEWYEKFAQQFPAWYRPFLPDLGRLTTESPRTKLSGYQLPGLMRSHLCFARMVKDACEMYPVIGHYCRQIYGPDFLKQALEDIKTEALKEIKEKPEDKPLDLMDHQERQEKKEEVYNKAGSIALGGIGEHATNKRAVANDQVKITVVNDLSLSHNDVTLSDDQKERMHRQGYLVRDYRKGDEVSHAYNINFAAKNELENPDQSGIYDLLVKPGEFEELLIINNPITGKGTCDFATVVRTKEPRNWTNCHRNTLWTRPQRRGKEEQREWYDKVEGVSDESLNKEDTYVVITRGHMGGIMGSAPFRVDEDLGNGRYVVTWHDFADRKRPTYLRPQSRRDHGLPFGDDYIGGNFGRDEESRGHGDLLYLSDREGVAFKAVAGGLMVPIEHKIIKVKDAYKKKDPDFPDSSPIMEPWHSEADAIMPGDWGDLHLQILQKTAELKLYVSDTEAQINNGPWRSKMAALFELIRDYGFREKHAKLLMKQAESAGRHRARADFRVKYAQGYPMLGPGPSAPAIPEPQYGFDGTYGGYPTQYQQVEQQPVPELSSHLTDQSIYDPRPEFMPDPMAMQAAQQAGASGQKEVFDTTMIASLLKAVRKDSLVDRYTGDLMKALDRLGRILFLFYWHNDEFMDRYGKSDMPELEDTLRNAFEVVGDLLLFLKEKDVDPLPGTDLGEPDVQESTGD